MNNRKKVKATVSYKDEIKTSNIDRFNFNSIEHLNLTLNQIMELEENGEIISTNSAEDDLLITIVRRALLRLPKVEKTVIEKYYVAGMTVGAIRKELGLATSQVVNNIRLRAVGNFQDLFIEEKKKVGITANYNACPICDNEDYDAIEERIHLWMDHKNWKLSGLVTEIKKVFNLKVTLSQIEEHMEYHMFLGDDRVELFSDSSQGKEDKKDQVSFSITIPKALKRKIEQVAFPYNITQADAIRWALSVGIDEIKYMFEKNERFKKVQLEAVRFLKDVRK